MLFGTRSDDAGKAESVISHSKPPVQSADAEDTSFSNQQKEFVDDRQEFHSKSQRTNSSEDRTGIEEDRMSVKTNNSNHQSPTLQVEQELHTVKTNASEVRFVETYSFIDKSRIHFDDGEMQPEIEVENWERLESTLQQDVPDDSKQLDTTDVEKSASLSEVTEMVGSSPQPIQPKIETVQPESSDEDLSEVILNIFPTFMTGVETKQKAPTMLEHGRNVEVCGYVQNVGMSSTLIAIKSFPISASDQQNLIKWEQEENGKALSKVPCITVNLSEQQNKNQDIKLEIGIRSDNKVVHIGYAMMTWDEIHNDVVHKVLKLQMSLQPKKRGLFAKKKVRRFQIGCTRCEIVDDAFLHVSCRRTSPHKILENTNSTLPTNTPPTLEIMEKEIVQNDIQTDTNENILQEEVTTTSEKEDSNVIEISSDKPINENVNENIVAIDSSPPEVLVKEMKVVVEDIPIVEKEMKVAVENTPGVENEMKVVVENTPVVEKEMKVVTENTSRSVVSKSSTTPFLNVFSTWFDRNEGKEVISTTPESSKVDEKPPSSFIEAPKEYSKTSESQDESIKRLDSAGKGSFLTRTEGSIRRETETLSKSSEENINVQEDSVLLPTSDVEDNVVPEPETDFRIVRTESSVRPNVITELIAPSRSESSLGNSPFDVTMKIKGPPRLSLRQIGDNRKLPPTPSPKKKGKVASSGGKREQSSKVVRNLVMGPDSVPDTDSLLSDAKGLPPSSIVKVTEPINSIDRLYKAMNESDLDTRALNSFRQKTEKCDDTSVLKSNIEEGNGDTERSKEIRKKVTNRTKKNLSPRSSNMRSPSKTSKVTKKLEVFEATSSPLASPRNRTKALGQKGKKVEKKRRPKHHPSSKERDDDSFLNKRSDHASRSERVHALVTSIDTNSFSFDSVSRSAYVGKLGLSPFDCGCFSTYYDDDYPLENKTETYSDSSVSRKYSRSHSEDDDASASVHTEVDKVKIRKLAGKKTVPILQDEENDRDNQGNDDDNGNNDNIGNNDENDNNETSNNNENNDNDVESETGDDDDSVETNQLMRIAAKLNMKPREILDLIEAEEDIEAIIERVRRS